MIDAPLALAFSAGMVATVNPCGFAMLPAYLSYFLGLDDPSTDAQASVGRALAVGGAMTLGFMAVFATVGAAISHLSLTIERWLPWVTIVIGTALIGLAIAMFRGFELTVALPKLERGGRDRTLRSMFVFGVSYAVASLSCTIPVFLAVVSGTFSRSNFVSGLAMYAVYALGMGLVLTVLTVALAVARRGLVTRIRAALAYVNRISAVLLLAAGAYVVWYGIYELRIRNDPTAAAGPVTFVTDLNADIANWVDDVGAVNIGLVLGIVACVATLFVLLRPATSEMEAEGQGQTSEEDQVEVSTEVRS